MRLALAQFAVAPAPADFDAFIDRIAGVAREAKDAAADILVLPEYAAMVLAGAYVKAPDLAAELEAVVADAARLVAGLLEIAVAQNLHILGGTLPMRDGGRVYNRAPFCAPNGKVAFQDKQTMTRFEAEIWGIAGGGPPKVFATSLGLIGVSICYDSEFPPHARAQVAAGAQIVLIPSCTDSVAGFNRVLIAARARALENQCFTAVSPLVGRARWSAAIDDNIGHAGLFGPPDRFFPDDGVIVRGELSQPGLVIADADLSLIARVRRDGAVLNHRDWPAGAACEVVQLS